MSLSCCTFSSEGKTQKEADVENERGREKEKQETEMSKTKKNTETLNGRYRKVERYKTE